MKRLKISVLSLMLSASLMAQDRTGTVKDDKGEPLPGVSVRVEGRNVGTVTDVDGKFSISAENSDRLTFSFVGMMDKTITVSSANDLGTITMGADVEQLGEVVVTALGQRREEKTITFSSQNISSRDLTQVKQIDFTQSLQGNISGLNISPGANGPGSATKIRLRGNRSLVGNNAPLIIIDGLRMSNFGPSSSGFDVFGGNGSNIDGGDNLSLINPDDIESINVLKGASAAALYGGDAANGVLVITTKQGKTGQLDISVSSNSLWTNPIDLPELKDNSAVDQFFSTGLNSVNTINVATGTEKASFYGGYAYTTQEGNIPNNSLNRHALSLKSQFRPTDKLTLDAKVMYFDQDVTGSPNVGLYFNPLTGLYLTPGKTALEYRENYTKLDETRKLQVQNWHIKDHINPNPWFLQNRAVSTLDRDRTLMYASVKYKFTDFLSLQVRANIDKTNAKVEKKAHAEVNAVTGPNGRYIARTYNATLQVFDALLNFNKTFGDLSATVLLGGQIIDNRLEGYEFDNGISSSLFIPNYFSISNLPEGSTKQELYNAKQSRAYYTSAQLGFRDIIYLDLTARQDWSSSLPTGNNSFFYPSVGLSFLLNKAIALPDAINLLKLRSSYAEVGNDFEAFITNQGQTLDPSGLPKNFQALPFPGTTLEPERTRSWELGLDLKMFRNNLNFSFTFYRSNTLNQLFTVDAPAGSFSEKYYINGGDIQNQGFEMILGGSPINTQDFLWKIQLNASKNYNEVIELHSSVDNFTITAPGVNAFANYLQKGGSIGDFYGKKVAKDDQGRIKVQKTVKDGVTLYTVERDPNGDVGEFFKLGNPNNQFLLGLSNQLSYKGITLSFLIDAKIGGEVMDFTGIVIDSRKTSSKFNNEMVTGSFSVNGTPQSSIPADAFYSSVSGRAGVTGEYIYSATSLRLRQLSLGYEFPVDKWNLPLKSIYLSFIGRNLIIFYKDAPFDPEVAATSGSSLQGIHLFGLPSLSQYGFNLLFKF